VPMYRCPSDPVNRKFIVQYPSADWTSAPGRTPGHEPVPTGGESTAIALRHSSGAVWMAEAPGAGAANARPTASNTARAGRLVRSLTFYSTKYPSKRSENPLARAPGTLFVLGGLR